MHANATNSRATLTSQEAERLRELEDVIAAGFDTFLKIGLAFAEVRFNKLHRATHARFDDYCRARWGLSASRTNQIINSTRVIENLTNAFPEDTALLAESSEHTVRPLSRLEPELQTVTWELIRHIEERPRGTTIEQVVDTIRTAIESGWQEREKSEVTRGEDRAVPSPSLASGRNGTTRHPRRSDELGGLFRWVNRVNTWDPEAIALADDELCLKRHLQAARQLRAFCETFIHALETRLSC